MSNQSQLQFWIRIETGTEGAYEEDWNAYWNLLGVPAGTFDERMLMWINIRLDESFTCLPDAQNALASSLGFRRWSDIATLTPSEEYNKAVVWKARPLLWGMEYLLQWEAASGDPV